MPFASLERRIKILSTGIGLPEKILHHHELDAKLGLPTGESFDITGVRQRYQSTTETAAMIAAKACNDALAKANLSWNNIDCLVATSATMDKALPYNAAMIHAELGLNNYRTMTLDIGSSCMSFLSGLDIMSAAMTAGRFQTIMLVSADISTFTVDYNNLRECGIFGDGAAAAVISLSNSEDVSRIIISRSITLSEGVDYCHINAGGSRYHRRTPDSNANEVFGMNGPALLELAAKAMPEFVNQLLADVNLSINDIDLVVPHQASKLALDRIARRLKMKRNRYINIFEEYGNQVSASLPTALHTAITTQQLKRGDTTLLVGTGAGITIGGMVLVY